MCKSAPPNVDNIISLKSNNNNNGGDDDNQITSKPQVSTRKIIRCSSLIFIPRTQSTEPSPPTPSIDLNLPQSTNQLPPSEGPITTSTSNSTPTSTPTITSAPKPRRCSVIYKPKPKTNNN